MRGIVAVACMVLVVLARGASAAGASGGAPGFVLPPGVVGDDATQIFRVNGRPTSLRFFRAPMAVPAVAAALLDQVRGRPGASGPQLLGLADGVLITWSEASWLWTIRLQRSGAMSTLGVVSGTDRAASGAGSGGRPAWLPPTAELTLEVGAEADGRHQVQQVYRYAAGAGALASRMQAALIRCGWRRAPAAGSLVQWSRGNAQLVMLVVATEAGSGLVLHIDEPRRASVRVDSCS